MNEKHKTEIEELLSELVDDVATDRQKTEFKRLAAHDPNLLEQLAVMQRQKQLLGALPVESAPDSLAEEITATLERKMILGDLADQKPTVAGTSHLYLRRVMTAAAMLLLPLGLLSFVVYEIMSPPSAGPANYVPTSDTLAVNEAPTAAPAVATVVDDGKLPFDGILAFHTDRLTSVSNYIERLIFEQKLNSFPNRDANRTTYQITASPAQIKELAKSLEPLWPYCQDISLRVTGSTINQAVSIPNVQSEQIYALASEDNRSRLYKLADQYATVNGNKQALYAQQEPAPLLDIGLDVQPRLTMPLLTGRSESSPESNPDASGESTVQLQIHIQRTVK